MCGVFVLLRERGGGKEGRRNQRQGDRPEVVPSGRVRREGPERRGWGNGPERGGRGYRPERGGRATDRKGVGGATDRKGVGGTTDWTGVGGAKDRKGVGGATDRKERAVDTQDGGAEVPRVGRSGDGDPKGRQPAAETGRKLQ
ncbi:hypothetical protein chiPu_0022945 [Chiloscyllium punctatum]|uniref:Uncharacterized protein n=1 Tax=Chiloscyllium punctatum TaxID=137246 RepID=A0A401T9L1_CHIPU|nr:hypothetical protein [Chiloscyllium punctatum]